MSPARRRKVAAREVEKALRAGLVHPRAQRELKAVIRELGERQGNPIRRLEGVLPYLRAEPAGHAAVALGMLEQAEAGR